MGTQTNCELWTIHIQYRNEHFIVVLVHFKRTLKHNMRYKRTDPMPAGLVNLQNCWYSFRFCYWFQKIQTKFQIFQFQQHAKQIRIKNTANKKILYIFVSWTSNYLLIVQPKFKIVEKKLRETETNRIKQMLSFYFATAARSSLFNVLARKSKEFKVWQT